MENFLNDFFPGTIEHLEKGVLRQPLRPHDTLAVFSKDDLGTTRLIALNIKELIF